LDLNQALVDSGDRPYIDLETGIDENGEHYVIRKFDSDIDIEELYWHRDDEDRGVEILECGRGWKIQFDNELPIDIEPGTKIFIIRHEWHRVIKGSGHLLIKIFKYGKEKANR
jgi:hypothetical protein